MLQPADDLRHILTPGPYARESLFYDVLLEDEGLMLFLYTWVDGDNRAGHLVAVVSGDDERLLFSAVDGVDVGAQDFDDWTVGALRVRHTDLLHTCELTFAGEGASLEVSFAGMHAPFSYRDNADGCPSFVADDRFEQSCRVHGTLRLGDREIAFVTTGHRDHSWGTRDWDVMQDWKWVSGQAGPQLGFNAMILHARGMTTYHGYVLRDGEVHAITSARIQADYDERWWQTGGELTLIDAGGRTTTVTAERFAFFAFEAGDQIVLHEAGCAGTIDGAEARVHLECGWERAYVARQAARAAGAVAR